MAACQRRGGGGGGDARARDRAAYGPYLLLFEPRDVAVMAVNSGWTGLSLYEFKPLS